ncbi:MAG TPA: c-type cytochrome, partial [Polyangiaceae bacterium]
MRRPQTLLVLLFSALIIVLSGCRKPVSPQLTKGAELYGRMCAVCHGAAGEGYKADQAPRLAQPDFQASVTDQYLR